MDSISPASASDSLVFYGEPEVSARELSFWNRAVALIFGVGAAVSTIALTAMAVSGNPFEMVMALGLLLGAPLLCFTGMAGARAIQASAHVDGSVPLVSLSAESIELAGKETPWSQVSGIEVSGGHTVGIFVGLGAQSASVELSLSRYTTSEGAQDILRAIYQHAARHHVRVVG